MIAGIPAAIPLLAFKTPTDVRGRLI